MTLLRDRVGVGAPGHTEVGGHPHVSYSLFTQVQAPYKFIFYLRNSESTFEKYLPKLSHFLIQFLNFLEYDNLLITTSVLTPLGLKPGDGRTS